MSKRDLAPQNNFDHMLTFNWSPFHHFIQEADEIWYPGRVIIKLLGYQISLTSCTKWWNDEQLKVRVWSKLYILWDMVPF